METFPTATSAKAAPKKGFFKKVIAHIRTRLFAVKAEPSSMSGIKLPLCERCPCCWNDFSENVEVVPFTLQDCNHTICRECAVQWIRSESSMSDTGLIRCPYGRECRKFFAHFEVERLLPREEFEKIDRRALESAVRADPNLHMCPTPDCPYIVCLDTYGWCGEQRTMINCQVCSKKSCFECGAFPFHQSMTCERYKENLKRQRELEAAVSSVVDPEEATRIYMELSGIKTCKQCKVPVEMVSGCLKMKCRCGYRFCFECGAENARCGHTPSSHGFWDNTVNRGDFSNLS